MADRPLAIVADRLIDGTGADPVVDAAVVWEGGRISAVGPRSRVTIPSDADVLEEDDLTLLPGLMDMHVHLGLQAGTDYRRIVMTQQTYSLLWSVPNARATLEAGFTTVRDAGLTPASVRTAIENGLFPGPSLQVAVQIIGQTGGHADLHMPCGLEIPLGLGEGPDMPHGMADSPDEMRHVVRKVLRAGADWIKLCTSGGVLSPSDAPDAAQLTVEEIAVAVYEAAAQGKRCMSHAMSARGIKNALEAGVATIEHGDILDEEAAEMMVERGAWLVPTIVAVHDVLDEAERLGIPDVMVAKARAMQTAQQASLKIARAKRVKIAMGTDAGVGEHGRNGRELGLMVDVAGLTPMEAIVATTSAPAELLGVADRRGTLRAGCEADIVAFRGDPIADIHRFDDVDNVRLVVRGGEVVCDRRPRRGAEVLTTAR